MNQVYPLASRLAKMLDKCAREEEDDDDRKEFESIRDALLTIMDPTTESAIGCMIEALEVVSIFD